MKTPWKLFAALGLSALLGFGLISCEDDSSDSNNTGADAVVGIWQHTEAGVDEETIQMTSTGAITWVLADLAAETCISFEGTWSADADSITTTGTVGTSSVAYTVSGNTLTIVDEDGEDFSYTRISTMIDCDHYNFGSTTGTMTATIDGTVYTLNSFTTAMRADGAMGIVAGDFTRQIQFNLLGDTAGTYSLGTAGNSATYIPNIATPLDLFMATFGMGSGSVEITSVANDTITGTFSFTGVPLSGTGSHTITNGSFSIPITQ
ncbi:MAG: hypothetical protein H6678_04970 [Candidatus Delongbacteria bacterium]|nr:hypothetical protein [Candidatus Delongbacteria bacterium]